MLTAAIGIESAGFVDGVVVSEAIQNTFISLGNTDFDPGFLVLSNYSPSLKKTAPLMLLNPLYTYHLYLLLALIRYPTQYRFLLILY
jgi:hypothetical protein